ncbi:hypothetical protein FHT00_003309 [Sphingomonas insulae]|uniref:Uncharacterized protein n=1 Tax=Sphingomonas insulae TaxID=424800 RepID=A0ABP3SVZ1_9SPHN|nr:hypothetical protein [Sphingomonas insulae]NIJ31330.1 hypothetical protein [Sphingomonas insulae]
MTDKQPMQAMSTDHGADKDAAASPAGKSDGESNGGAYPNPHTGKGKQDDVGGGFMGHGGQSHVEYSGTGDDDTDEDVGNGNAVTK